MNRILVVAMLASSAAVGGVVTAQVVAPKVQDVYPALDVQHYSKVCVYPVVVDGVVTRYDVERTANVPSLVEPTRDDGGVVIAAVPALSWTETRTNVPATTAQITALIKAEVVPVDGPAHGLAVAP